ncbi:MAG: site-specific integrase [Bacteroidota bacterium]|nr:site-specific integrase [Bacteroidota bacterium]
MASIKIIQREQKINENGEAPLWIRVTKNRKSHFISLGLYVNPKDWDALKQRVKKSHPNSQRVNNFLAQKVAEAENSVLEAETNESYSSPKKLKQAITGTTAESFTKYFEEYLKELEAKHKHGTLNNAQSCFSKFRKFTKNKDIYFDEINVLWLKGFENYLRKEFGNSTNTVHSSLKVIRRMFYEAVREDIIPIEKNPFLKYKLKWENVKKEYLTEDEINAIENQKVFPNLQRVRDLYVFAVYAGGIRISDLLLLKVKNFDKEKVIIKQKKTREEVSIKLTTKALSIVTPYLENKEAEDFVFPFLSKKDEMLDEKGLHDKISSFNAYINRMLKQIADYAGIKKSIHFHTSRHTFATLALKKGIRLEYVSKLMGHNSIRTTQIYAKIVNEELDKAMMDAFG